MGDPYTPNSGDPRYAVRHYALDLSYTPRTNRLVGAAKLSIEVLEKTRALRVDLVGLRATKVRVNGATHRDVKQTSQALQLRFAAALPPGAAVTVDIDYAGSPAPRRSHWGQIGWEELEEGALVAAQPTGSPTWFPCNDRVSDRARYDIRFTTDREFFVAATGVPGPVTSRAGKRTWTFTSSMPSPTYLIAIHVGPYTEFPLEIPLVSGARLGRLVTARAESKETLKAFAPLHAMTRTFEEWFGPYPQEDLTVVVVSEELEIPLESQGLITFGVNHAAPSEQRLIAHELAHQWFGNSVSLSRWQDIWLNEGFCCYAEWIWSEESGGATIAQCAYEHHAQLMRQPQDLVLADPGAAALFDDRVYKRGALLLEALRRTMGAESFRELMRAWAVQHAHRAVRSQEFTSLAQSMSEVSLDRLWQEWLGQPELPALPRIPKHAR